MQKKVAFFKEAIKSIKTSGAFIPSSRFLVKKILMDIDFSTSEVIVEYGPGNGTITKEILKKLKPSAILICFEINETFLLDLRKIENKQLIVLNASAENVKEEIEKLGFTKVDNFISSLPLAILPKELSKLIVEKSYAVLQENGRFVQYQYSTQFLKQFKAIFSKKIVLKFEPLNLPPALIYICEK